MKYLKIFTDFRNAMNALGEAERGRLISAMLEYADTGEAVELRGNERVLFEVAKAQIDAQMAAYDHRCSVNKKNIDSRYESLRMVTNRSENLRMVTNRYESKQDQDQDQDQEQEKISKKSILVQQSTRFERFWSVYPRRQAKKDAERAWIRLNPDDELTKKIISGVEEAKRSSSWRKESGKFIPLPASYLNGRRWEDEQVSVVAYDPWENA